MFRTNRLLFIGVLLSLVTPFTVAQAKVPSKHLSDTQTARLNSTAMLHNQYQAAQSTANQYNTRANYGAQILLLRLHYNMTKKSKALQAHATVLNKSEKSGQKTK